MTEEKMKACFNEWMRRFIEDPAAYSREFESVVQFQAETNDGVEEPSYGSNCAAYMKKLAAEI